jgi:hypothetical protein
MDSPALRVSPALGFVKLGAALANGARAATTASGSSSRAIARCGLMKQRMRAFDGRSDAQFKVE